MADRGAIERAVLACGGTGGHVYPAVAIAREILARQPNAGVTFVGRPDSYESRVLEREGFEMDGLDIGRLAGQGILRRLGTLAHLPGSVVRAGRILARRRPEVVVGTGGFVSGPTMLAAVLRRLPTVVQEQNAFPGITNRVLGALAGRVALAHARPGAGPRHVVTGNPVRPEFFAVQPQAPGASFRLLVLGGSQGARRLNELVWEAVPFLADVADRLEIVLQCGPRWEADSLDRATRSPVPVEVRPYLDDVPVQLARASLVLCRAGASTVAELCAAGRPALLVPFPHAAADHQTANARALASAGAAEWVVERELSGTELARLVRQAMGDPDRLRRLADAARVLARPDAAARIVDLAEDLAHRRVTSGAALPTGGAA